MNTGNVMCTHVRTSKAMGSDISGFCARRVLRRVGRTFNTGPKSLVLVLSNSSTVGAHGRLYRLHLRVNGRLNLHSGGGFTYL